MECLLAEVYSEVYEFVILKLFSLSVLIAKPGEQPEMSGKNPISEINIYCHRRALMTNSSSTFGIMTKYLADDKKKVKLR